MEGITPGDRLLPLRHTDVATDTQPGKLVEYVSDTLEGIREWAGMMYYSLTDQDDPGADGSLGSDKIKHIY